MGSSNYPRTCFVLAAHYVEAEDGLLKECKLSSVTTFDIKSVMTRNGSSPHGSLSHSSGSGSLSLCQTSTHLSKEVQSKFGLYYVVVRE